jgi:hypothetical protein
MRYGPIWLLVANLLLLNIGALIAQDARMSVIWKMGSACGANFPSAVLQQELEEQFHAAGLVVSRIQVAGLVAEIDCQLRATT